MNGRASPAALRERLRPRLGAGVKRLRENGESILQTAIAAGIAWFIAVGIVGHERAYFAPTAAIMALGLAPGRRTKRTVQIIVGIGLGILIGQLVVVTLGAGPLQLALLAGLALAAAVLLDGTPIFVSQMAASAVFMATLEQTEPGAAPSRFLDALIGGVVGVAVIALVNRDPVRTIHDATGPALDQLAAALDGAAGALSAGDADRARRLQAESAALVPALLDVSQVLERVRETTTLSRRSDAAGALPRYRTAVPALALIAGDVTGVARSVARAIELEADASEELVTAARKLAMATRNLKLYLRRGQGLEEVRSASAAGAELASGVVEGDAPMPIGALVGELRATSADLLRATGLMPSQAVAFVRESASDGPPAPGLESAKPGSRP